MNHLETLLCSLHHLLNIILYITGHCILTYVNAPDDTVIIVVDNQGIWTVLTERRVTVGGLEEQKWDRKIKRIRMEHVRRQGWWIYRRHERRKKSGYQVLTVQKQLLLFKRLNLQLCLNVMSGWQDVLNLLILQSHTIADI